MQKCCVFTAAAYCLWPVSHGNDDFMAASNQTKANRDPSGLFVQQRYYSTSETWTTSPALALLHHLHHSRPKVLSSTL